MINSYPVLDLNVFGFYHNHVAGHNEQIIRVSNDTCSSSKKLITELNEYIFCIKLVSYIYKYLYLKLVVLETTR